MLGRTAGSSSDSLSRFLYGLFVVGSLFTRGWHSKALEKLRTGSTLARLKVDAWVKASWMYGVPSWFLWGATLAFIVFVAMGLRMTIAAGKVETFRQGARTRRAQATPRERHIVEVYVNMIKIPSASILRPESTLPASKNEIKAALIAEGLRASRRDIHKQGEYFSIVLLPSRRFRPGRRDRAQWWRGSQFAGRVNSKHPSQKGTASRLSLMPGWPLGDCLTPILALHCPRSTIANALLTSRSRSPLAASSLLPNS